MRMEARRAEGGTYHRLHAVNVEKDVGGDIHGLLGGRADVEGDGGIIGKVRNIETLYEDGGGRLAIGDG
jgi:hypothetical protein